jgi:DNA-binding PadR family transcriptional regulator
VLLGYIGREPRSGYGLKKVFSSTPASVYQRSPGALYPALRRLVDRGMLRVEKTAASGQRTQFLYHLTDLGRTAHLAWLREPVEPASVGSDLGVHLMRFAMMEDRLEREEILAFLKGLAEALEGFVADMERYIASGLPTARRHPRLALEHGIAMHRASLGWARSAMTALSAPEPEVTPGG